MKRSAVAASLSMMIKSDGSPCIPALPNCPSQSPSPPISISSSSSSSALPSWSFSGPSSPLSVPRGGWQRPKDSSWSSRYGPAGGGDDSEGKDDKDSFYATLGVSRDATLKEITRGYRRMCVKHHPDKVSISYLSCFEILAAPLIIVFLTQTTLLNDPSSSSSFSSSSP